MARTPSTMVFFRLNLADQAELENLRIKKEGESGVEISTAALIRGLIRAEIEREKEK